MKIKLILLFLFFYFCSLLITLPADKVISFIPAKSGIKIAAVSGTVWDGAGSQLSYKRQFYLKHFEWNVDWSALMRLQLKVNTKFDNGAHNLSGKGSFLLGVSGISVENFMLDISAPELLGYLHLPLPAKLSGDLSVVIKEASQGKPYCQQLDGYLVWQNAQIKSELGALDLDSAHVDLRCEKGQIAADLQQKSNQISSTANVLLKEGGSYKLEALLKAEDKLNPSIKDALSWIGAKNQSGETEVNFSGKL